MSSYDLISSLDRKHLTIDIDATIVISGKESCLRTYRAATDEVPFERVDQPIVASCKELGMLLHLEMRDGNVSAKTDIVRFLEETLALLPSSVLLVGFRMDGAGDQMDVIRSCNRPSLRLSSLHRFGKIGFVLSVSLYPEAKENRARTPSSAWLQMDKGYMARKRRSIMFPRMWSIGVGYPVFWGMVRRNFRSVIWGVALPIVFGCWLPTIRHLMNSVHPMPVWRRWV